MSRERWVVMASVKVRPHYAAQQNATHYSFAAWQKLLGICRQFDRAHIKKEFFADYISQVIKTEEQDQWTLSDFFLYLIDAILKPLTHHMPRNKPLMRPTFCRLNFDAAWHATHAEAMPHWRPHYCHHLSHGKAAFCCILSGGIVWMPLYVFISLTTKPS